MPKSNLARQRKTWWKCLHGFAAGQGGRSVFCHQRRKVRRPRFFDGSGGKKGRGGRRGGTPKIAGRSPAGLCGAGCGRCADRAWKAGGGLSPGFLFAGDRVGGSNGKTTTKELLASVLRQKFSTLWSEASFNNDIGVPATLLRLEKSHQAAVLEVGTNHPGELAPLVKMIQPNMASSHDWARTSGIFWRRRWSGAGRRLAGGIFAGRRKTVFKR